jgi:hypothetical protein
MLHLLLFFLHLQSLLGALVDDAHVEPCTSPTLKVAQTRTMIGICVDCCTGSPLRTVLLTT